MVLRGGSVTGGAPQRHASQDVEMGSGGGSRQASQHDFDMSSAAASAAAAATASPEAAAVASKRSRSMWERPGRDDKRELCYQAALRRSGSGGTL